MTEAKLAWHGVEQLRPFLAPIVTLEPASEAELGGDYNQVVAGLQRHGQLRPVLLNDDGRVSRRVHTVIAAEKLGWTHVAVRSEHSELAVLDNPDQMSFVDEAETGAVSVDTSVFARAETAAGASVGELEIEAINEDSADPAAEWVGLPEFLPAEEKARKVVVSVATAADQEALLDTLGIDTIHQTVFGRTTRTVTVWWPDRPRSDLVSLYFGELDE